MPYSVLVPILLSLSANFYAPDKEAALGAQLAAQTERETTPLGLTDVDQYVDALGHRLAAQMPGHSRTWTFRVIRDQRGGSTCEPVSLPGGYVFVPAQLFLTARTEAEFAGMLAHSMAHIVERHGMQPAPRGEITDLATTPLVFLGPVGVGDESTLVPVASLKSRRQYELEADRVAARAIAGAGYNPQALLDYVSRMQQQDFGRPEMSPLPAGSVRMANLQQTLRDLPAAGGDTPAGAFSLIQGECRQRIAPAPTLFR